MTEETETVNPAIDPAHFHHLLGHFCSGITIISSHVDSKPVGLTCQSFFSVSLEPPLVAFAVSRTSTSYPVIRSTGTLVINVLASHQYEISNAFAKSGTDKWNGVSWSPGDVHGHPRDRRRVAFLECEITNEIEYGDHLLVIAHVLRLHAKEEMRPLLYFQGTYRQLEALSPSGSPK